MTQLLKKNAMQSLQDIGDSLDPARIPHHVAIIMDGNRRWARKHGKASEFGHWMGAEIISDIVKAASNIGVKILTLYAFSTENWERSKQEVEALMLILEAFLIREREEMQREGVKLETIGDLSRLPQSVLSTLKETQRLTASNEKIQLVLALNYGGRDEICRASLRAHEDFLSGKIKKEDFNENIFASYLDTAKWGDPQLLIRTSGEMRISNFLLWQISYAELVVLDTYWPDFTKQDLYEALASFQIRTRRLGK